MPTTRSIQELEALRVEAEKRVRLGESRAQVARALEVSVQTLAGWALRHGWRKMDLEAECDGDLRKQADALVEELNAKAAASDEEAGRLKAWAGKMMEGARLAKEAAEARRNGAREEAKAAMIAAARVLQEIDALDKAEMAALGQEAGEELARDAAAEAAQARQAKPLEPGEITTRDVTLSTLEKVRELLEEGRLEDAERAARVAWRMRATADAIEIRDERLRLLFEEKLVAAAEARRKAVVPGFYPDRDPKNYEEKIEACMQAVLRVAYLERRAAERVEMEHSNFMGFRWPGADAPWFKRDCMAGTFNDDPAPPVWRFEEAHPDEETRELTVQEKAEVAYLKGLLWRWGSECDPFNREWRIANAAERGELASLRRHAPEMWKGLVLEEAPAE